MGGRSIRGRRQTKQRPRRLVTAPGGGAGHREQGSGRRQGHAVARREAAAAPRGRGSGPGIAGATPQPGSRWLRSVGTVSPASAERAPRGRRGVGAGRRAAACGRSGASGRGRAAPPGGGAAATAGGQAPAARSVSSSGSGDVARRRRRAAAGRGARCDRSERRRAGWGDVPTRRRAVSRMRAGNPCPWPHHRPRKSSHEPSGPGAEVHGSAGTDSGEDTDSLPGTKMATGAGTGSATGPSWSFSGAQLRS